MDQLAFSSCCWNFKNTCTALELPSVRVLDRLATVIWWCLCLILTLFAVQRDIFLVSEIWLTGAEQECFLCFTCGSKDEEAGVGTLMEEEKGWNSHSGQSSVWAHSSTALTLTLIQRTSGLGNIEPLNLGTEGHVPFSDFSDMTFSHGPIIYSVNLGFLGHWKYRTLGT